MSSTYLLLFLLCISLHACHARPLGTFDKKLEKKIHISIKNDDEKKGLDSPPKQLGLLKNGENGGETRLDATNTQKPKVDRRSIKLRVLKVKEKAILSGASRTNKSHASVSWRVPHKKTGEKNPGFNSDYSPPKTHPPIHN
ncbi:hypothetical protein L6164_003648 [Bauhinia variegata]|uniref:Uncharacterized protein n=1 Tax=Bauhinia variegata TaxID=167791 RepID=A0ACB9Q3Z8_BAUVA|nr:hypothetical protein L6164_003648 [Bauhinia variegata]